MKTLFIIGAQRSGTTFLNTILSFNKNVISIKGNNEEPRLFLKNDFPKNLESIIEISKRYNPLVDLNNENVILEKSTSYYEHEKAAKRIKKYLPQSKIIFIARDPYKRMISNYEFSKKNNLEKLKFEEAILNSRRKFNTSVNPYNYIERSLYSKYLSFWIKNFNHNLKIILFEEMIMTPNSFAKDIFSWIDIKVENDFFDLIKNIKDLNSSKRSDTNYDFGNHETTIKNLFEKEKLFLEKHLKRTISCWSF